MRASGLAAVVIASLAALAGVDARQDRSAAIDRAFEAFWAADHRAEAADRAAAIVRTGVPFEVALARVRQGRAYAADVPKGRLVGRHRTSDNVEHQYAFVVPETYDPTHPYQVRVQLHGGVNRARPTPINRLRTDALAGTADEIVVYPTAWIDSAWWFASQVDNVSRILDRLKRTYNVDENRVYLLGSSDGATGAFFFAFRDTTPWASFIPLIGDMMVLSAPQIRADGDMFPGNAAMKPLYIVSAGRDRLYPAHVTQIYAEHLTRIGAEVVFRVYPDSEHTTAWWPDERGAVEQFVNDHPREPLPDRISWQTDRVDRYNRAHWLVIDRLGTAAGESRLDDTNLLQRGRELDFGVRINSSVDRGRRITEVVAESNAAAIGLRSGDRLIEVNGSPVSTGRDLAEAMQRWDIGETLRFNVERGGRPQALQGEFKPTEVEVPPAAIFPRRRPSGRVDLVRKGNTVEAATEGVRTFTLLLSPSLFDFRRPIRVTANGRTVFDGMVEPDVATMLKWAARDDDRTMVFGAELTIELGS